jgi:thiol-disulfide isomerase/thioredoxin
MPLSILSQKVLVGPLSKEEILKNLPEWQEVAASYIPNPAIIEKLNSINKEVQVELFIGTWCPDCRRHVSAYFKILEMTDNPLIVTSYTGIPREREARQEFIQGKSIERVPTFIIYIDGQEKGRIIETPTKSVEEDLLDIINR